MLVGGCFFRFIERPLVHSFVNSHQTYALPSCACVRMLVREVVGLRDTLVGRVHQPCWPWRSPQRRCGREHSQRGGSAVICR